MFHFIKNTFSKVRGWIMGGGHRPIVNPRPGLSVKILEDRIVPSITLSQIDDQSNHVGDQATVILMATSTNNNPISYAIINMPAGPSLDENTGSVTGAIAAGADLNSPYWVTAVATDTVTAENDSKTFYWHVAANEPTVTLMNPGDQSNFGGDLVNVLLMATDSAGNPLSYSASGLPTGLSLLNGLGTANIEGTIANGESAGIVTITATDAIANVSASQTFGWFVSAQTVSLANPGDQTSFAGSAVALELDSFNGAYRNLTFSANGLPAGLTINSNTGQIFGTVDVDASTETPSSVTVTASDPAANVTDEQTFSWSVALPVISGGDLVDQGNFVGDQVDLIANFEDSAGNALTYAASNLPDGVSLDPVTGQISGTISAAGAYEVTVTATDPIVNVTDTISFTWTITIPAGPIPRGSDFVVDESGSLYVPANLGVLANAYNPASVALTAELTTGVDPSAGTLDFHDDGSFTFVAASGWDGMASFEFHLAQNPDAAAQVFIAAQDRLQGDTALYFVAFQSNANILNDGKFTATSQSPHGPDFLTNAAPMRFGDSANYMQWLDLNTNGEIDGAALSSGNVQNAWRVDHQYPASFTRNTAISLHVGFKIAIRDLDFWRNADRWITVGATGPGELTLGSTHTVYLGVTRQTLGNVSAYVLGTGPVVEAPGEIPPFNQATGWVDMDGPLPNATAYYSSFQLDWRIHVSNRWITPSAHVSSNEVFVTLAPPNGSAANAYQEADARKPAIYHSVFYAGIWGSIGATNQDQLVQYVFAGFQSLTMTRADGTAMKYYGNWTTAGHYINTRLLIQEGDGNCYAWAHLLIDALNAQGGNYTSNGNGKTIFAKNPTYDYFLVKSWQIPQGPGPYPEGFVNFNIPVAGAAGIRWDASGYIWGPNPEVISPQDGSNAPGQNQANPMSAFANHSVVEIDGKWYDPSYGLIYDNNLGSFESIALSGYGKMRQSPVGPLIYFARTGTAATVGNRLVLANGVAATYPG